MEKKEYKFKCGITAEQHPLKVGEARRLYSVFKSAFNTETTDLKLTDLLDKIIDGNMLNDLFSIILKSDKEVNYDELELDEAAEVLADFFSLNRKTMSFLGIGSSAQAGS